VVAGGTTARRLRFGADVLGWRDASVVAQDGPMATGHDAATIHDDRDHTDDHGHDDHDHGHDDHDHGHDDHDGHGHVADAGGWVLIPLVVGAVVGLVLAVVFGIGADALPIV
jgi:hypothetical protein